MWRVHVYEEWPHKAHVTYLYITSNSLVKLYQTARNWIFIVIRKYSMIWQILLESTECDDGVRYLTTTRYFALLQIGFCTMRLWWMWPQRRDLCMQTEVKKSSLTPQASLVFSIYNTYCTAKESWFPCKQTRRLGMWNAPNDCLVCKWLFLDEFDIENGTKDPKLL